MKKLGEGLSSGASIFSIRLWEKNVRTRWSFPKRRKSAAFVSSPAARILFPVREVLGLPPVLTELCFAACTLWRKRFLKPGIATRGRNAAVRSLSISGVTSRSAPIPVYTVTPLHKEPGMGRGKKLYAGFPPVDHTPQASLILMPSRSSRNRLRGRPAPNPPRPPSALITRWQGMTRRKGFLFKACPMKRNPR